MSRSLIHAVIVTPAADGTAVIVANAAVDVYRIGTASAPSMFDADVDGSPVANPLISNAFGVVEVWLDETEQMIVDLSVSDNGATAVRAGTATPISFDPYVEKARASIDASPVDLDASSITAVTDTAANLAAANPLLGPGRVGYAIDTHILGIGDGSTLWNDLPKFESAGQRVLDMATSTGGVGMTGITTAVDYPGLAPISYEVLLRPVLVKMWVPWASCNTAGQGTATNITDNANTLLSLAGAVSGTANGVVQIANEMWLLPGVDDGPHTTKGRIGRTGTGTCTAGIGSVNATIVASLVAYEW